MKTKVEAGDVLILSGETFLVDSLVLAESGFSGAEASSAEPEKVRFVNVRQLNFLDSAKVSTVLTVPGGWVDSLVGNVYGKPLVIVPKDAVRAILTIDGTKFAPERTE